MLTPEQSAALAEAVQRAANDVWLSRSPIVSRDEGMAYARIKSLRSWWRFCQRHSIKPMADGARYSRAHVERAARCEERTAK